MYPNLKKSLFLIALFNLITFISKGQEFIFTMEEPISLHNKAKGYSYLSQYDFNQDQVTDVVSILDSIDVAGFLKEEPFLETTSFRTDLETSGVEATDFNADGKMDLVVGSYWGNRFSIYLGGDEQFSKPAHYPLNGHCSGIKVAFINDDHDPDIIAIRNGSGQPIAIHVFLNQGDGTFEKVYYHESQDHTNSEIQIVDFNSDAKNDILIRSSNGFILSYLQEDPQTFIPHYIPIMPFIPGYGTLPGGLGMGFDDFDGDQIGDLLLIYSDSLIIRKGLGDGRFAEKGFFHQDTTRIIKMYLEDLDNDGISEIIGVKKIDHPPFISNAISIFQFQPQSNSFILKQNYPLPFIPEKITTADFTGDLLKDIAILTQGNNLILLKAEGDPLSTPPEGEQLPIVYPNPTSGQINLSTESFIGKSLSIEVYTINGKLLQTFSFPEVDSNTLVVSLAPSASSPLILKLTSAGLIWMQRIFID